MCTGSLRVMDAVVFPGHINIMMLAGVESGEVRIQTSGDICIGTSEVFHICNEHQEPILASFIAYRAETHEGGFANC